MHPYRNVDGHSGVIAYEPGEGWIRLRFVNGKEYRYTDAPPAPSMCGTCRCWRKPARAWPAT